MTEDAPLLRQFVDKNSESAFRELVARRIDFVYTVALRQVGGDPHVAEEITQDVFLDLARKARELASRSSLAGWLYTSTRFAAAKARRSHARRRNHETRAHAMNELLSARPAAEIEWSELRPVIDEAMHKLGESDREAILLRYFEGRSLAEVGSALGLSENSARMRLERALEKLRRNLARCDITSTAAALGATLAAQPIATAPAGLALTVAGAVLATRHGAVWAGPSIIQSLSTAGVLAGVVGLALLGGLGFWFAGSRPAVRVEHATMAVSDLPVDEPRAKTRRAATGAVTTTTKAPLTPSGAPTLSTEEQRAKITFTLRVISLARLMFIRRTGRAPSSLAELADQRLMQAPVPVDGEQYESVDVANDDVFSVTTKSGLTVVLDTTTTGIGTPIPLAGRSPPGLDKKVFHALSAWRKAHGIGTGPMPRSAQELLPYFATASDGADYVEWLEYVGWPQR